MTATRAPALFLRGRASFDAVPLFEDLSLEVPAGQWTCLLGSSGVGKSTVLRLFAGLADEVRFDGEIGASEGVLKDRVALMAQDDLLLPWLTVLDNVMLGARLRGEASDRARAEAVLARVGLADRAAHHPDELSGGQRQRVALARTLMEDRPIVLLDEPFSALDARTRARMQELTAELLAGRTVLLVTHDPAEAARLGHVVKVMHPGGLTDFPPPASAIPRAVTEGAVLDMQARLLAYLREEA